jgi:hypothetical protein
MRPVLRPGLRLLRDASGQAALVDRDRAYRLDHPTADLLERLDGLDDEAAVLGLDPPPRTLRAWTRLCETGVVVDAETALRLVREVDETRRGDALPEATALLADHPPTAEARWQARRRSAVALHGRGAVTSTLRTLLHRAGIGTLSTGGDADADVDVAVLTGDHEPPTDAVERLMRAGRAHLVAGTRGGAGAVGPFVRPGVTACLRCVDLTRCQADPLWGTLRDRLSAPEPPHHATAAPAAGVVVAATAALAAAEVLAHVEGRDPATLAASASITLHQPLPVLRRWPVHPSCGCGWQMQAGTRGQWTA